MKPTSKLRYQINTNFHFAKEIQALMEKSGIAIRPLIEGRDKAIGFMAESGNYEVAGMIVNDHGHYANHQEARHWGIEEIAGYESGFTIAQDIDGGYWITDNDFVSIQDESVEWKPFDITSR